MANGSRSPLGELVFTHRTRLGLSQQDLSDRTLTPASGDPLIGAVSVRTIASLEAELNGRRPRRPQQGTAHSLAVALELAPGTAAYAEFMTAAGHPVATTRSGPGRDPVSRPAYLEAGREAELRRLAHAIGRAAGGTPTAMLVRGEPGSGRTATVEHACRHALERHRGAVVLATACTDPADRHGPFKTMIRLMLGDPAAIAMQPMGDANASRLAARTSSAAAALVEEGPLLAAITLADARARARIVAGIADRGVAAPLDELGRGGPTDAMRAIPGCEQFLRVLGRYAALGPTVLVFDDLDRADEATLASLAYLLRHLRHQPDLPVGIIATSPPGEPPEPASRELDQLIEDLQRRWPHAVIDLDATTRGDSAHRLAAAMLDSRGLPSGPETIETLLARTDGLPLHMVTLLDAIIAEPAGGAGSAVDRLSGAIPPAAAAALDARVRPLGPVLREILVTASVLGEEFFAETVMEMLGLPDERFIELVDRQLWRRHHLLRESGKTMIAGRPAHRYRFHPPLLRDALYLTVSNLERAQAHGRAADALIALYGDRDHDALERIADHLDRAGRRVDAARTYLRAGERARMERRFEVARRLLGRVSELEIRHDDPETWIVSLIGIGLCERGTDEIGAARPWLNRALDMAISYELPLVRAKALEALGLLDFDTGHLARGQERVEAAIEIWAAHNAPDTSRALANLGFILYGLGRYDEAIAIAERARREATRTGQDRWWIDGTIALANCWIDFGRYPEAAELYDGAVLMSNDLGDFHRERICRVNLALIAIETGAWDVAERENARAVAGSPPPSPHLSGIVLFQSGLIAEGRADLVAAAKHYGDARAIRLRNEQEPLAIDAAAGELRVATATADPRRMRALTTAIERHLADRGIDGIEHPGRLYASLIQAALALGDPDRARAHARAGVELLGARSARVPEAYRQGYLWAVPWHRRLLEMATELGIIAG